MAPQLDAGYDVAAQMRRMTDDLAFSAQMRRIKDEHAQRIAESAPVIAAAEARTADCEDRLRRARAKILAEREGKLKQWSAQHDQALADARAATAQKVKAAKGEIEQSVAIAQLQIDGVCAELSEQIVRAVMPAGTRPEAAQ